MAFTTWEAVRSDLKNVMADYALTGKFMVQSYRIGDFSREIHSIDEARKFYQLTYDLESIDSKPTRGRIRITGGAPV